MSDIKTEDVKALREQTGISIMQCKKALEEAGGDAEKAIVILQRKSKETAAKKAERELGAGVVQAYIHNTNTVGAMVELSCETDFVANNEEFKQLAYDIAMHITAENPQYMTKEEISDTDRAKVEEVLKSELEGTPEDKRDQIMQGKLDAYFKGGVLLEQSFVKNPDLTIANLIESAIQKFGENINVTRFTRFSIK
ncbi:MAG: elongation factor Ts [Candidatus Paceibacterota bacterium]